MIIIRLCLRILKFAVRQEQIAKISQLSSQVFIIIILACWGLNPVGTKTLKKMKITNCNRLAGSERALE